MSKHEFLEIERKSAVLIGVGKYLDRSINPLNYSMNDVEQFHRVLVNEHRGGYPNENVHILADDKGLEELPSRSNVMAAVKLLSESAGSQDSILLYFSGHGFEEDGICYLLPFDARANILSETAIPLHWMKDVLKKSEARAKILILDACHAGARIGKSSAQPMSKSFEEAIFTDAEGFAILSSCKANELSHEWPEKEQSVFSFYLMEGLMGQADRDADGIVTVSDASQYTCSKVRNWSFNRRLQQSPTLEYNVSGDLLMVRVPRWIHARDIANQVNLVYASKNYLIILSILARRGPAKLTHLMYRTGLQVKRLQTHLDYLIVKDLVQVKKRKKGKLVLYSITGKGIDVLKAYRRISSIFSLEAVYARVRKRLSL